MQPNVTGGTIAMERPPEPKSPLQTVAQIGVYIALVLGVVPYGAVHDLPKLLVAIAIILTCGLASWLDIRNPAVRHLVRDCWLLLLFLIGYCLWQAYSFENNPLAHPFWKSAGELAGFQTGAISVEPSLTQFGLFSLAPPFLLYIAILQAFQKDEHAWRLIKFLGYLALAFILYGLVQAVFFPDHILFRDLGDPYHALTGTLLYRNAAATLIGVAGLVMLAIVIYQSRGMSIFSFPAIFLMPKMMSTGRRTLLLVWIVATFLSFTALFLTHSRGALGATMVAWALITPPLLSRAIARSTYGEVGFKAGRFRFLRRILYLLIVIVIALGFVNLFAEETLFRFAELKGENSRFCNFPAMWRIFMDNWQFGTGFGTFEVVFPIYRDPTCGVDKIWMQAHNFWLEGLIGFGVSFIPVSVFVVGRLVWAFWTGVRTRHSQRFISYIGLGVIALVGMHSYVDFSMQIPGVALYVTATLGAITVLSLGRVKASQKQKRDVK